MPTLRLALFTGLAASFAAWAQTPQHNHQHAAAPTRPPAQLLEGLGTHTHPIATPSAAAQQFFDQGLALIYGFNHDEAARLFARAAELDPASPMPHWGIALALGPNYNMPPMPEREEQAWRAIGQAMALAPQATPRERAYVEALVKRYSRDPQADRKQLAEVYRKAMKDLAARYPDDLDAQTLYAESIMNLRPWALWSAAGEPAEGTLEIVDTLERILRRNPNHPGANHYYIHAVEASRTPERALPSAMRLGKLMPGAGHMVHMPSHIFIRTGDHEQSTQVNITASDVDKRYLDRTGAQGVYRLMYYSHNLHFVAYSRMMQGEPAMALDYARRLRANVSGGAIDQMPMLATYGAFEWLVLTRFGQWEKMLAETEPAETLPTLHAFYRYARGLSFAALGRVEEAQAERERLMALHARIPEAETQMISPSRSVIAIGIAELDARIARARQDSGAEITHLRRAVELQEALSYMEPPEWHYSLREALGGAMLRAGQTAEAEAVFRRDLEVQPRNPRALFGLAEALRQRHDADAAAAVQREFSEAWQHASVKLATGDL
ncbi:MAG: hypothetical protein IT162_06985 [Bryobacterales bacterium]|nr:hypothetical protein [Bryobacterales bacterium]